MLFPRAFAVVTALVYLSSSSTAAAQQMLGTLQTRAHGVSGTVWALSDKVLEVSIVLGRNPCCSDVSPTGASLDFCLHRSFATLTLTAKPQRPSFGPTWGTLPRTMGSCFPLLHIIVTRTVTFLLLMGPFHGGPNSPTAMTCPWSNPFRYGVNELDSLLGTLSCLPTSIFPPSLLPATGLLSSVTTNFIWAIFRRMLMTWKEPLWLCQTR